MKKTICVALALVAGASLFTAEAAKKKTVQKPVEEKVQAVQLTSSSDSVSYAAGMTMTNGLLNYLLQQKMDTTMMADFVRGFMDAVKTADDPRMKAYMTGQNIAQQLNERIGQRARVHAPKECYVLFDRVPSHASHPGTLAAARTEVVGKNGVAVTAVLHAALVAIDIVQLRLLPVPEAAVVLF